MQEQLKTYVVSVFDKETDKLNLEGCFSGEHDKNNKPICFETSMLRLPNGQIAKLKFDYGQLSAYFASFTDNSVIIYLKGVNNNKSFYLRDCEIVDKTNQDKQL